MAFDTSGFNFAAPQEQVYTPALANMAPLQMQGQGFVAPGMAASPFNIQAPSTAVAQGIAAAMGSLGKGIEVGFQSSQKAEEEKRKEALDEKKLDLAAKKEAVSESQLGALRNMQMENLNQEIAIKKARLDGTLPESVRSKQEKAPWGGFVTPNDSTMASPSPTTGEDTTPPVDINETPQLDYLKSAEPPISILKNKMGSVSQPTGDKFATLNNLGNDIFNKGSIKYLTAQNVPAGSISDSPTASSQPQVNPLNALTPEEIQTQNASKKMQLANLLPTLAGMDTTGATYSSMAGDSMAKTTPVAYAHPVQQEFAPEDYHAAVAEAGKKYPGYYDNPDVVEGKHGGYLVKWQKVDEAKDAYKKSMSQYHNDQLELRYQGQVQRAVQNMNTSPQVKNLTGANGLQQAMPRAFIDAQEAKENPMVAGTADQALIDLYVRAQTGTIPRENQIRMLTAGLSVPDKLKMLGMKMTTGGLIPQDVRDMMQRVVGKDAKIQTQLANQQVEMLNDKIKSWAKSHGQKVSEDDLAHPYVEPEFRPEVQQKHDEIVAQHASLVDTYKSIMSSDGKTPLPGKEEQAQQISDSLSQSGKEIKTLKQKLKNKSYIVNMDDILTKKQGAISAGASLEINPNYMMPPTPPPADVPEPTDTSSN